MSDKAKQAKAKIVDELVEKIKKSKSIVVADFRGISVLDDTQMRSDLRKADVEYEVIKNNLMYRALEKVGVKIPDEVLSGPSAFAFGYSDPVAGARILGERQKGKKLVMKAGVVEGKVLDAQGITAVANIPSKEILVAQLLGLLQSPIRNLAVVLAEAAKKKA
ncbi:MAG: 50S ribosomal protein L10 [Firmicutes bacterium]|nr:50S ribosomal protein L10 [Bacillota bacterium]